MSPVAPAPLDGFDRDALQPYLEPHHYDLTVYVEDTDFTGAMYHGRLLCYCGRARAELLGTQLIAAVHRRLGVGFVVHSLAMRFKRPARFGDRLRIRTELAIPTLHKLDFQHTAYRISDGEQIADAQVRVVCVNELGRPVRVPIEGFLEMRRALDGADGALEARSR